MALDNQNKAINQKATPRFEDLTVRNLYFRGHTQRRLFSVEDAAIDIHNRLIDIEEDHRTGVLTDDEYEAKKAAYLDAGQYFNGKIADNYFSAEECDRDDEDRILTFNGKEVKQLDIEGINALIKKFRQALVKEKDAEFADQSYLELYKAGIFRYKYFSVEEASIDIHNRIINLSIANFEEEISDFVYYSEKAKLEEAKTFIDSEMVNLHFLFQDCKMDPRGRYSEVNGHTVKPIDLEEIRQEFIAVRNMQLAADEKNKKKTGTSDVQ